MGNRFPVMICTRAKGGMRSVVESYVGVGLIERWEFKILWSHEDASFWGRFYMAAICFLKLLGLLVRRKVSFLHLHMAMRGSFWRKSIYLLLAKMFGRPSIVHLHGSEFRDFYIGLGGFRRSLVRWTFGSAECVIVLSRSWKDFVESVCPTASVKIVQNFVEVLDCVRDRSSLSHQAIFLGFIGHRKGIYDLLAAWQEVVQRVPDAVLLIGGNGEIERARDMARGYGIERSVKFLGWISAEQRGGLLNSSSIYVLPSYNEGLPMGILEAMASSVSVVTTPVGGIPELIVNGMNGVLVAPGEPLKLAEAIVKLFEDENFRKFIERAGNLTVRQSYSVAAVVPKLDQIYTECSSNAT